MAEDYLRHEERIIAASPATIFALLADPQRHADIDGSGSVVGVDSSSATLHQGAEFSMKMRRGAAYKTGNVVVEFEPDRVIAWQTQPTTFPMSYLVGGRIWRYELTAVDGGTRVRETWDAREERNRWLVVRDAGTAVKGMRATLERIEQLVTV